MKAQQRRDSPVYRLDAEHSRLWRGTQPLPLRPKPFAVLQYLSRNPGRLITKEELHHAVWSNTHVSRTLLKGYISELRSVLRDDPHAPAFIKTVGRQGYEWIGSVSEITAHEDRASPGPHLVGRAEELAYLRQRLDIALAGRRQIVFITGEPGIGKTALVEAFLAQESVAHHAMIGHGQCIQHYGTGEAYLPILEALTRLCRGAQGALLLTALEQHAPTWLMQMPAPPSAVRQGDLQHAGSGTRERMLRELAEGLEAVSADRGLILWLEDLQWSDHATLDWLSFVARRREMARLMLIGTYRPVDVIVRGHPLKVIKQELQLHGYCEDLSLSLLSSDAVVDYLEMRFGSRTQVPLRQLARIIHRRTEGNALFMINLVDYAISQSAIVNGRWDRQVAASIEHLANAVPVNLRQLIEKELERLTPEELLELEAASVAGQTFSAAAVAPAIGAAVELVEEHCADLARRALFVRESGPVQWPDDTIAAGYTFLHAFYRQVLYERVPVARRARLHKEIAQRLEVAYGARAKEIAAELADHFERGRAVESAVQYLWYAAKNAGRRYAPQEMMTLLRKALELLNILPDNPERGKQQLNILLVLARALEGTKGQAAAEVGQTYARARELCERLHATAQLFLVLWGLSGFHLVRGELREAHELGEELRTLAQAQPDPKWRVGAHMAIGIPLFWQGDFGRALEHLSKGIVGYVAVEHEGSALRRNEDYSIMLSYSAIAFWHLGYPDQALRRSDEALASARKVPHPACLAVTLVFAAWLSQLRRDSRVARQRAEEAIELATEHGLAYWLACGTILEGWAQAEEGRRKEGLTLIERGLTAYAATGAKLVIPYWSALLAETCGGIGRVEQGLRALDEAFSLIDNTGERSYEAELYRLRGQLIIRTEVPSREGRSVPASIADQAELCFLKAISIARHQGAKSLQLRATMSLGQLWQSQKKQEAYALLSEMVQWFTEGFETKELKEAKALLDQLN